MSRTDEVARAPIFGYDANSMTLYLRSIPRNLGRQQLANLIRDHTQGFVSLSMSEPLKMQNFERYAWISFDSDENCRKAKESLEKISIELKSREPFRLTPVQNSAHRKNIMITPELPDDSIERDLNLCKRLIIEVFEQEKEVPLEFYDKITDYAQKFLSKEQHLDLLLLYLRRVHSYCFYCGEEYDDERTLAAKCGP